MAIQETVPQHLSALQKANRIRLASASLKRQVAGREMTLEEAIHHEAAGSLEVGALLCAIPRVGTTYAEKVCARVPVPSNKRVDEMTLRQKVRLIELMEGRVGQPRRPRTDVELIAWLGGDRGHSLPSKQHLHVPGAPRTLCGRPIPDVPRLIDGAESAGDCGACWRIARW